MASKNLTTLSKLTRLASTKLAVEPKLPETEFEAPSYDGPSYDHVRNVRDTNLNPVLRTIYKKPLLIHSGKMQWLYDHEGRRYLDMFGGVVTVSVGHCHPRVTAALQSQIHKLWHTTNIYLHPKIHEFAEKLVSTMPKGLDCVYFVNSGSEANDLAMSLSRMYTGNFDVISLRNAYHGGSPYTLGLTAHDTYKYPIPGVNNGIIHAMNADPYKGIWGGSNCRDCPVQTDRKCDCGPNGCQAGKNYIKELGEVFKYSLPKGRVAAMFAESIQGVGGIVQFPKNYIKEAAKMVRANGGLFISDEVQTGFGRTGDHFWGFEGHGIVPDIVTMAKGIGNGFPIGAVVTRKEIASMMSQAAHFNTYGGNPLSSAVGVEVLNVIKDEGMQENSLKMGNYFLEQLAQLRDEYEIIGDVRGKGLMIGVEFVSDKDSKNPLDKQQFLDIWEQTKDMGVLFGTGGAYGNVLRVKPPMCINKADVDFAVDVLKSALDTHKIKYL
ncbi:alanine--glyoxylate aminotransferase 2, mitochondrial [Culicoides brevitarsis]|uniref:alanine--glyoxylate aminotransferase 2, mitochondrial n=1 Tax=Culicoides brevitarsis TaxID=469753 RepID=UPI00307B45A4